MAEVKPHVDQGKCIGCGTCPVIAPDVFKMNETGKAEEIPGDYAGKEGVINQAKDACPVQAISV